LVGKPEGTLKICANLTSVHPTDEFDCLIGEINLTRLKGKSTFSNDILSVKVKDLFDQGLEGVTWNVDVNTKFRVAQFVVVEN
jgi:hypothetical protein